MPCLATRGTQSYPFLFRQAIAEFCDFETVFNRGRRNMRRRRGRALLDPTDRLESLTGFDFIEERERLHQASVFERYRIGWVGETESIA